MMRGAERAYRCLLLLLPAAMRREAEGELLEVFRQAYPRARARGAPGIACFWAQIALDTVVTSLAERTGPGFAVRAAVPAADPHRGFRMSILLLLRHLTDDARLAARRLARTPGWTVAASGTLSLGIAASVVTAILVRDVLDSPLPLRDPDRLVWIREVSENGGRWWPSFPNAADWRAHLGPFEGVGIADVPVVRPLLLDGAAVRVPVARAAEGLFETLGIAPARGRFFTRAENRVGAPPVAIVSHRFWRGPLDSRNPGEIALTIGTERFTVVGVLPADFKFLGDGAAWVDPAEVWTPMERDRDLGSRTTHGYHVVGRLKPDVALERARMEMNLLAKQLEAAHREPTQADSVLLTPLHEAVVRRARDPLRLLSYAAAGVLLVSCFNVAAAILAQGLNRARELSLRMALGAGRATVARHLLLEAAVLAAPATAAGLLLAGFALRLIQNTGPATLPRLDEARLDPQAAIAAAVVAGFAACAAGLLPAFVLSREPMLARLRSHGPAEPRSQRRLWTGFVAAQIALTLVLLVASGLLIRSFVAAISVDVGYDARNVLAVDVTLPESTYAQPARRVAFYEAALSRLRTAPGVEGAGITSALPFDTSMHTSGTQRAAAGPAWVLAGYRLVDEGYFETLRIARVQGSRRALLDGAVIDRRLQQQLWQEESAMQDRLINGFSDVALTVSGVVASVREWNQDENVMGAVYVDFRRRPGRIQAMHVVVRHDGNVAAAAERVREAFAAVDPLVPITIGPLDDRAGESLSSRRLMLVLSGGFAAAALLLAASGIYAMVAFAVGRYMREAAIRVALGARPSAIRSRVLLQGLAPAGAGILAGAALAIPVARAMRAQLFHVEPVDPAVLVAAAATVAAAAVLASAAPAQRAARVDAAAALRQD